MLRYGVNWSDKYSDLHIELFAFRDGTAEYGGDPDDRPFHFKNIVRMFWGPKSRKHYVWDPWTDRMLRAACEEKYLQISGCASSRKTTFCAVWGIANWLCAPTKTLVLVTSTNLDSARRRIWGEIEGLFMAACDDKGRPVLPGKLVGSMCKIRTFDDGIKYPDNCGLALIAGDPAKEKENIGKLIGLKNKRVFLIADELPELSPALVTAAKSNLMANDYFQMISSGNFNSIYDPFGQECTPIGGWGSVNPDMDEWQTKEGLCLRFDGLKSPNILCGTTKYPGQYSSEHLANHRKSFGENSAEFWRMCRSFPCPEADADRIYSEADFVKGDAQGTVKWRSMPVRVAALDPAFATGGDRAMAYFGEYGMSTENRQTLFIRDAVCLREDVRKKDENRSLQICKLFRDECEKREIVPENSAYDASGGGLPFGALLSEIWSSKPLGVQFGGAASDRPASSKDRRPAREAFANRVAEIWFAGVDFVQSGQIKGLPAQACSELTERRKLRAIKGSAGLKLRIESKEDMKKRTGGRSPDDADAFLILCELCRVRLGFQATGMEGKRVVATNSWKKKAELSARIWRHSTYTEPEMIAA